jgi:hypothetical protein
VDGVDVELAGDARLGLVLAEAEHADAGDEHDRGAGVAHGRRVRQRVRVVVGGVLGAVGLERLGELRLEVSDSGGGVPVHEERADLGADEVVRATGAEVRELLGRLRVDEVEHVGRVGKAADHALLRRDAAADDGHQFQRDSLALGVGADLRAAEADSLLLRMLLRELAELIDDGNGAEVALALRLAPGEEAVAAEDDPVATGCGGDRIAQHQGEFKAGTLPRHPHHLVPELLIELRHLFEAVGRGCQRDGPVRVQVIDVRKRKEAVQRCVDGGRDGIVAEGAERIHTDDLVLAGDALVAVGEREHLVEIERGEAGTLDAAEIAARALDPEDLLRLAVERVHLIRSWSWCCHRRSSSGEGRSRAGWSGSEGVRVRRVWRRRKRPSGLQESAALQMPCGWGPCAVYRFAGVWAA